MNLIEISLNLPENLNPFIYIIKQIVLIYYLNNSHSITRLLIDFSSNYLIYRQSSLPFKASNVLYIK